MAKKTSKKTVRTVKRAKQVKHDFIYNMLFLICVVLVSLLIVMMGVMISATTLDTGAGLILFLIASAIYYARYEGE